MKKRQLKTLIFCFAIVIVIAVVGGIFTSQNVNSPWYSAIKPQITPPNFVFPIAWTILFILIAISMFFAWENSKNKKQRIKVAWLFGVNLFFNMIWSFLFFGLRSRILGFVDILIVWFSIAVLMIGIYKSSKVASWILLPYLFWVSYATLINAFAI